MVTGIKLISQQKVVNSNTMGLSGITTSQVPSQETPVKRSTTASDTRRSNKPIMEKRRRARINNCLNELKTLILDAMKKDPARHSKLEKADILEMTVKYLQNHQLNLQRQQAALTQATDATIATKFKAGFTECANEVGRFPGMEPQVKRRLLQHLNNCMNGERNDPHQHQIQVHILPSSPPSSPEQESMSSSSNGYYLTNGSGNGVQLIPTKLSNGTIAFVLPQSPAASQIPMLVPIPSRTASTGSATSSSYDRVMNREQSQSPYNAPPSPANSSYEPMDTMPAHLSHSNLHHQQLNLMQQHQQQQILKHQQRSFSPSAPISLVMRKTNFDQQMKDDEKPWRPW
ncbi:CLUMA_CG019574, isoform A [Clunio marinus]|uniref:CLUMA_CG019574, isoform A n=1 Tax=Clunio marinus TaxID=568069 RepID=A0A1J1J523_9DIPT|nr:CLUMA_CG019574, isoform A [Clunio marinus]